jgi:exodeoxyribonuclease V beta subunit
MAISFDPAREPLDDLEAKTLLVSASAGTGKTWLITDLASRWLLEADGRLPESILLVTFSRTAAAELKSRVRTRLIEIRDVLENPETEHGELPVWLALLVQEGSETERAASLRRLRAVLPLLEGVNARTIHSFAATVRTTGEETRSGEAIYARAVNETITRAVLREPARILELEAALSGSRTLSGVLPELAAKTSALGGLEPGRPTRALLGGVDDELDAYLISLVREVAGRVDEIQTLDHVTTFDALIAGLFAEIAGDGASRAALIENLRTSFDLVLIDEFQDTDQAQWEIFSDVFVGHVPVVIVGDPKQAIYRFRGGDVVIFQGLLDAAEQEPDRYVVHHLVVNRRSSPTLVGHLNALFMAADAMKDAYRAVLVGDEPGDDDVDGASTIPRVWGFSESSASAQLAAIDYELVDAARSDETAGLVLRDVRRGFRATRTDLVEVQRYPKAPSVADADDIVANDVARYLVERLSDEPDPEAFLRRVAILVRTGDQAAKVRSHLRRAGIPAVLSAAESVFSSMAAQQLRLLLWAMSDATNPRRSGLLVHSWFADHVENVRSLAESLTRFGPGALNRRVLTGATMARVLLDPNGDGERTWTDLEHLLELLVVAFPRSVSPQVAARWLEDQMSKPSEDEGQERADARRIESDRAAVKIMTSHKAKGLEFDIVLLPFMEIGGQGIPHEYIALSEPGGRRFEIDAIVGGNSDVERANAYQESDEGARRLYVALTRGRDEVIAWISDRAALRADDGTNSELFFTSSLWLQLAEPISFLTDDECARLEAVAGDLPFSIPEIVAIDDAEHVEPRRLVDDVRTISTVGVKERPWIDESLRRRWSYSYLGLSGIDVAKPDADDVEDDAGFDAGALGESEPVLERDENAWSSHAFGGFAGTQVGNALHAILERVVGDVQASELDTMAEFVQRSFESEGLVLDDPMAVIEQLKVVLDRRLGPLFDDKTLDSFAVTGMSNRVAKEMNFTVALGSDDPARGDVHDVIADIAAAAIEHDGDGPYRSYFEGLAREPAMPARLFQGFLNGSIDLVAQVDDTPRFVIVDYKSNVAARGAGFTPAELVAKMAGAGYPLQALLYSVALHRYLGIRLPGYSAERNLGGALYLFLRGIVESPQGSADGLAAWKIPAALVEATSSILGERQVARA